MTTEKERETKILIIEKITDGWIENELRQKK